MSERLFAIIGPDGKVHYTRPEGHLDLEEARKTPGYSVKEWVVNPEYEKAQGEVYIDPRFFK